MTQKELGLKIGQTKSNISKYERGIIEPNIQTLNQLSAFFRVSIDYLVNTKDIYPNLKPSNADISLTDVEENLLSNYRKLNSSGMDYIDHQMEIALQLYKKDSKSSPVEEQA